MADDAAFLAAVILLANSLEDRRGGQSATPIPQHETPHTIRLRPASQDLAAESLPFGKS